MQSPAREPSNCLPTGFQLASNCLCVGPPITPVGWNTPQPGWNRAGRVPTPRLRQQRLAFRGCSFVRLSSRPSFHRSLAPRRALRSRS